MRFKADNNIDLPDISEVYIGDEFYMFLQYKGESNYLIEPQNCTAFSGNDIFNSGVSQVTLWKIDGEKANHCVSKEAKNLNLLGSNGFTYIDEKTVRTRLNGFRFNTNVKDITIFCRVLLKLPSSESGKINSISTNERDGATATRHMPCDIRYHKIRSDDS
ncbi:unnamed protein product [Mytilus edulis]|uniref:Uncharacterized protein n=1 Tax=Mytilus edulis TaxID=6550 RepID=A0A8S3PX25_MYTED|nr:unnamed protein product [Mytilus edulis]